MALRGSLFLGEVGEVTERLMFTAPVAEHPQCSAVAEQEQVRAQQVTPDSAEAVLADETALTQVKPAARVSSLWRCCINERKQLRNDS